MKKSLIALAVLAASGAAMAQSSVTLYGIVDAAYGQVKTSNTPVVVGSIPGVAPAPDTPVIANGTIKNTGLSDGGVNGLATSRWGIRGSEDLGNGLKANFNLEQGLNVADGSGSAGFGRRAVVGLSGEFGAVDLGREYTPIYSLAGAVAVDGLATAHKTNNLAPLVARRSNSLTYTSPSFGGVQIKGQIGQQKQDVTTDADATLGLMARQVAKDTGYGLTAAYANGPLVVGVGYDRQKGTVATNGGMAVGALTKVFAVGGSYDLGVAKLVADYVNVKFDSVPASGSDKSTEFNAGVRVPFGAVTVIAGFGRNKEEYAGGGDASGTDYVVGADYALSKRTTTYARVSQSDKYEDYKVNRFAVGVKHAF